MSQTNLIPRRTYERAGFWFASGVLSFIALLILLTLAAGWGIDAIGWRDADDCDASVSERCGMKPRVDALTGCEYLETAGGGITPRLDASGAQVCRGARP